MMQAQAKSGEQATTSAANQLIRNGIHFIKLLCNFNADRFLVQQWWADNRMVG